MINRLRLLFHWHKWEEYNEPFDTERLVYFQILPTEKCSKCGMIRKYFGPTKGWRIWRES